MIVQANGLGIFSGSPCGQQVRLQCPAPVDFLGPPPPASKHRHLAKDTWEVRKLLRAVNASEGDLLLVGDVADFYTSGRHVGLAKDASIMVCHRGPGSALDLGIAFALWIAALPSG